MSTTPQTEAQRLASAEPIQCAEYSIWEQQVRAELRRLDTAHTVAVELAAQYAAERDQLRAQVERLQATEPFGYFRAEPFGWTDCAETDEGAIALYERPAAPAVPGWKWVPVEPTEEMLAAVPWPGCARTDWSHMLAAAPTPPTPAAQSQTVRGMPDVAMELNRRAPTGEHHD